MQIVTAQSKEKDARVFSTNYDFGATVADSAKLFTEEICKNKLDAQLKVDIQGSIRAALKAGKTDEEIQALVDTWMPCVKAPGKSVPAKMDTLWDKLSDEEKQAMLKKWAQKKKA